MSEALEAAASARRTCSLCGKKAVSNSGLLNHMRNMHKDAFQEGRAAATPLRARTRQRQTWEQKAEILDRYLEYLFDPKCLAPLTETAKWAFGAAWQRKKGFICKWLKQIGRVREAVQNAQRGSRRGGATRKPDFPDCEDELYVRFLFRRLALGYPCNHFWLISEFKKILVEASPPEYKGKKYSKGWVVRFCMRYGEMAFCCTH